MVVEVVHECTKAQAIAAALSMGKAGGSKAAEEHRRTLLGTAKISAQHLLTRPRVGLILRWAHWSPNDWVSRKGFRCASLLELELFIRVKNGWCKCIYELYSS